MPNSASPIGRARLITIVALAAVLAAGVTAWLVMRTRTPAVPAPGSATYEQIATAFYRGLAELQVGLLENAVKDFTQATTLVPEEPASWANLAVAHLRLGDVEMAAAPLERAASLAPDNGDVALLAAQMEIARGRLDDGIAQLRRAAMLDPRQLRARFALAEELERAGTADGDREAAQLLDELQQLAPGNIAVLLERGRVAAKRSDAGGLNDSIARLAPLAAAWPAVAMEQYANLRAAAMDGNFMLAARTTALLRNVLARVPAYSADVTLVRTPAEIVAEPFDRFLLLEQPVSTPAPADLRVTFSEERIGTEPATVVIPVSLNADDDRPVLFAADTMTIRRVGEGAASWPFPGKSSAPERHGLAALDWNNDFRTDLLAAGAGGIRLFVQNESGGFDDRTRAAAANDAVTCDCSGAWAADLEMDGDLDVVVGARAGGTIVLRNNGDGTWTKLDTFAMVIGVREMTWADLDRDADPDAAFLDGSGRVRVFLNRQAGQFTEAAPPSSWTDVATFTAADIDADGGFDLVAVRGDGIHRISMATAGSWSADALIAPGRDEGATGQSGALLVADLDNNGALDLIRAGATTQVWMADERHAFAELPARVNARVTAAVDVDGDGRVDLAGTAGAAPAATPVRLLGRGERSYHWKQIRVRAQPEAGDQRVNSFGVGGEIEVRAGLLRQKQGLAGLPLHFGLGARTTIDVARIVWPNGIPQAEFGTGVDDAIVVEQRLKGSCPWVFADDGTGMQFVTDFLWRSPLGLRINAQDTAGVSQTEDWVRIRGDQLAPRDGKYDVRITAELWETHFFDHVSLMVVDHPADTDVFVDERFSMRPVSFAVHALRNMTPVANAIDQSGRDVTSLVTQRDGRYLATFAKGPYQGIATDHFVEFEIPRTSGVADGRMVLVAYGWVYPTDSSINVAIAQGRHEQPRGLSLEAQDANGGWHVAQSDLGFPAGKNKTMLIELGDAARARRLRLRTNLEVYWDSLSVGTRADVSMRQSRLAAGEADLRYRGFSRTRSPRGEAPETPVYAPLASRSQRWRDLIGYHTRFGDVRELIAGVDDRYVIMNAGDELAMRFEAAPPAEAGWRRDFFLIGDGWEKDGDYNTEFSQTVLPLPSHGAAPYDRSKPPLELEDDPVYQRHRSDWERYHTRYVTPDAFLRGLGARR